MPGRGEGLAGLVYAVGAPLGACSNLLDGV